QLRNVIDEVIEAPKSSLPAEEDGDVKNGRRGASAGQSQTKRMDHLGGAHSNSFRQATQRLLGRWHVEWFDGGQRISQLAQPFANVIIVLQMLSDRLRFVGDVGVRHQIQANLIGQLAQSPRAWLV